MGKAIKDKEVKAEEIVETAEVAEAPEAEKAETGDEAVDAFLNGETEEIPEGTEIITEEEAEELEKAEEYKIEAPNASYSGLTATVEFKEGIGKTTNKVVAEYFKARNYKVTVIK
jgi:hypothetical protein